MIMGFDSDRPLVDAQYFTDVDAYVYEAIATLEYSGSPVTGAEIVAATDLDDETAGEVLDALTEHGVVRRTRSGTEEAFALARRDWSATPDRPSR
jgi:DNA-binding IclR family transcriptional regulator